MLLAIALQAKFMIVFFVLALAVGVLIAGPRDLLRRPAVYAGAAITLLAALPGLWWQARHGWPQLEMAAAIGDEMGPEDLLPWQFLITGPLLVPLWAAGLWGLARVPRLRPWRLFAWAYPVLVVVFLVTGGKHYYLAGAYPALWAAGAVVADAWLGRGGAVRRAIAVGAYGISAAGTVLLTLPVYPVASYHDSLAAKVSPELAENIGWPRFAVEVARVHRGLPPGERAMAVLMMVNYGEAGAIDRYGPALGLPRPYSPHVGYHLFRGRPPETSGTVILVGPDPGFSPRIGAFFDSVTVAGQIDNGVGVDNEEQGKSVFVLRGRQAPWSRIWPASPLVS